MEDAVSSVFPVTEGAVASPVPRVPDAQPPAGVCCPSSVPEYVLLRCIGSGAYGDVWLARNIVGGLRAVKILRRDRHESVESFEREFKGLQKFEPISRTHEGLVDILTLGLLPDGVGFYYVMELADDASKRSVGGEVTSLTPTEMPETPDVVSYTPCTLRAELKKRGAWPADEVIVLGLRVAAALMHLHASGLVHRDVKPSNILFIGGEPKLADAGLVADIDDARSLVGTAGYIAPEGPGTPQADLYALGKVLYEVAFGKDRREFPCLPADVASRSDHGRLLELNEVIGKACASDSRERYGNASLMLAELTALESGDSIKRQRARHQIWSHATKVALAIACAAIPFAGAYGVWIRLSHPNSAPRSAEFVWSRNELANEDFLQGVRALQAEGDNRAAIDHFKNAIQKDPNFAEAYARLAWAHYSYGEGDPNPQEGPAAAEKAVQLNPKLGYAHSMLATARIVQLNWAEAEKHRNLAVSLNPTSQEILLESALNLASMGQTNEALRDLRRARRANPVSASNKREIFYAFVYGWCREYEGALEIYKRYSLTNYFSNQQRALVHLGAGDFTNYMQFAREAALGRVRSNDAERQTLNTEYEALQAVFMQGGARKYWELNRDFESSKRDPDHWIRMAAIHAHLDETEEAVRCLQRAARETPNWFAVAIYANPSFDRLRTNPQFRELTNELWREE